MEISDQTKLWCIFCTFPFNNDNNDNNNGLKGGTFYVVCVQDSDFYQLFGLWETLHYCGY